VRQKITVSQTHPCREFYDLGYKHGLQDARIDHIGPDTLTRPGSARTAKPRRKLSAWNKFVKANSKKPRFVLRSGKLNLKKMGVAFRKTPAGKKKR